MIFYYSDHFDLPLPPDHRFPGSKYGQLRQHLLKTQTLSKSQLTSSPVARPEYLIPTHSAKYVEDFVSGHIDPVLMKRIGFPWSEFLVERTLAVVGGAIAAAEKALEQGLSGQLAGGTHHAHYDYGAGYCIFNDFAVVATRLLEQKKISRIAIVDLDVHQGDGNASLLKDHPDVFVFSMHGEKNFPFRKYQSDLDIALPDGCEDEEYLKNLQVGIEQVLAFRPELVLYQAGVDIIKEDKLGRLNITMDGLAARDLFVFQTFKSRGIPISMAIGGGYADPIHASVVAYAQTYEVAKQVYQF